MTQPSEAAIRKACEEAGIVAGDTEGNAWRALVALARRIEAESAGVVAWMYTSIHHDVVGVRAERAEADMPGRDPATGWTETPLYAHPQPDARAEAAEAKVARLRNVDETAAYLIDRYEKIARHEVVRDLAEAQGSYRAARQALQENSDG